MTTETNSKKDAYSKKAVAEGYDHWRFGGRSGQYVSGREIEIVESMLSGFGKSKGVLDVACGTGRFSGALSKRMRVVCTDYSKEMLRKAGSLGIVSVRADALHLPFKDSEFDAVVMGRLFQHYKNIEPFLSEARRVTKKNGFIIFDILRWSPRNLIPSVKSREKVFRHSHKEITDIAHRLSLEIDEWVACFLFSPGVYRFLPFFLVRYLHRLEKRFPEGTLTRVFYKIRIQ